MLKIYKLLIVSLLALKACLGACEYVLPPMAGVIVQQNQATSNIFVGATPFSNFSPCIWGISGLPDWISVVGPTSHQGDSIVTFNVQANTGIQRDATISLAGSPFIIEQVSSFAAIQIGSNGSMPHIAAQDVWNTTFVFVNKATTSGRLKMFMNKDSGAPLFLYLQFPQESSVVGPLFGNQFDRPLDPNASVVVSTVGSQNPPAQVGAGTFYGTRGVDGFAIFRLVPSAQEAVVPLETRNASAYILAFDNTGGASLGAAVQNAGSNAATIGVVIRDDTGLIISDPGTVLSLPASGHTSFVLSDQYPVTANQRGTIEFDRLSGGPISVLGIRSTPLNDTITLTTVPALVNSGNNGGSIAHIATGSGWQTTFVLVNTGTKTAQATLKFYATGTGSPLSIPLSFPQSGGGSSMVASSVTQTLADGASFIAQSTGSASDPAPTIGSAQLTTDGNVGGFVIFRYNPNGQEAVVPLENRTSAAGFVIAFDNTAGTTTGIAVNSVSTQATSVPVIIRDDTGAQIGTDTLNLAANAHTAFTLGLDKYPFTAGIRGTIEFVKPSNGQIGALGIRVPPTLTFTTLPALAK